MKTNRVSCWLLLATLLASPGVDAADRTEGRMFATRSVVHARHGIAEGRRAGQARALPAAGASPSSKPFTCEAITQRPSVLSS